MRPYLFLTIAIAVAAGQACLATEIINFDLYPDGSPVPEGYTVHDQWSSIGVVFTMGDSTRAAYAVPHVCSLSSPNHVGGDPTVIAWFVNPLTGEPAVTDFVGTAQDQCWGSGEGIMMTAYDINGQVVAQEFNSGPGNLVTFSFAKPTVAKIRMHEFQQGIDDFRFNTPVAPGVSGVAALDARSPLRVFPNPGSMPAGVLIRFDSASAGPATIEVYDLNGRLVRSLSQQAHATDTVQWDGRDERGNAVASGVYLVRWVGPSETTTARVAFLR